MAGLLLFGKLVAPCVEKLGFVKYQNCSDLSRQSQENQPPKTPRGSASSSVEVSCSPERVMDPTEDKAPQSQNAEIITSAYN